MSLIFIHSKKTLFSPLHNRKKKDFSVLKFLDESVSDLFTGEYLIPKQCKQLLLDRLIDNNGNKKVCYKLTKLFKCILEGSAYLKPLDLMTTEGYLRSGVLTEVCHTNHKNKAKISLSLDNWRHLLKRCEYIPLKKQFISLYVLPFFKDKINPTGLLRLIAVDLIQITCISPNCRQYREQTTLALQNSTNLLSKFYDSQKNLLQLICQMHFKTLKEDQSAIHIRRGEKGSFFIPFKPFFVN